MSVQEEVFRVKYEEEGSEKLAKLQSIAQGVEKEIGELKGRMAGPWSTKELERIAAELKQAEANARLVQREIVRTEAQIRRSAEAGARAVEAAEARKRRAIEASEEREARRRAREAAGAGTARREAALRTGFGALNMVQDFDAAGFRGIANNLINPMMWSDLATTIGTSKAALVGFGAAATTVLVAAGTYAAALGESLSQAGLGWSDLDDVLANSTGVVAASAALDELTGVLGVWEEAFESATGADVADSFGELAQDIAWLSGQISGLGGLVEYAAGWDSATEAARRHKAELEEVERVQAVLYGKQKEDGTRAGGATTRFKSEAQQEAERRFALRGQALAEMGGEKGIDGLIERFGGTQAIKGAVAGALGGDAAQLKMMLGGTGIDTTRLDMALRGTSPELEKKKAEEAARDERAGARAEAGEDRKAKAEERKAKAEEEKAKAEEEATAGRWSSAMGARYNLGRAAGGEASEASIAAEMERAGAAPALAKALASTVLAQLEKGYVETVATRAAGRGETFDQAAAGIVSDEETRKADEAKRAAERARREAEEADRPRREALAGRRGMIDRRADLALQFDALRGGDGSAVVAQLAAALKANGLGGEADAKEIVDERKLALEDRVDQALMAGTQGQGPAFRQVETLGAQDYIRRVQDGAAAIEKEHLDVARESLAKLTELVRARGGFWR